MNAGKNIRVCWDNFRSLDYLLSCSEVDTSRVGCLGNSGGGVFVMLANDKPNCEFTHSNQLAETFGIHFIPERLNPVTNHNWEMGAETNLPDHPLFKGVQKIYMKEVAGIKVSKEAKPVLTDGENILMAETTYGKGKVLAIGDPWLYNEYIGNSRLPVSFENMKAAHNFVNYLLSFEEIK
jgi:hypothetical protein